MSARLRLTAMLVFSLSLVPVTNSTLLGQTSDVQPPTLTDLSFTPTSVDVTAGAQTVTFTISATDNLSGLSNCSLSLISPSGAQSVFAGSYWPSSGPPLLTGITTVAARIPRYSEPGVWTISNVGCSDMAKNYAVYSTAALTGLGFPTTITVADATPDLAAPLLTAVAMTPAAIDVSVGPVNVQVDLTVTDAVSGVIHNTVGASDFVIASPTGKQSVLLSCKQFALISGNLNSGVWRATVQIPQYVEAGTWKVTSVVLRDTASNSRSYTAVDLATFGASINLAVASTVQDVTPPSITAIRFTPSFVNTSLGPQTVQVELDATDDLAGVRFAPDTPYLSYILGPLVQSPSGVQLSYVSPYGGWTLVSGNPLSGTWRGTFNLLQYSEEGTWAAESSFVRDAALNGSRLSRQAMEALGLTTTFVVIKPSLVPDGSVGSAGGTVQDSQFASRASITFPAGAVSVSTTVAIDVLQSPLSVPLPTGFSGSDTFFVNIQLNPEPAFPLAPPGLTVVLPLRTLMPPGAAIYLYRINTASGALEPSLDTSGYPVVGYVDATGDSATFTGVSRLSTVVGLQSLPIQLQIDIKPGDVVNSINRKSHGVIPVLIYGTPTLDASKIDVSTLRLSGASVSQNPSGDYNAAECDCNGDGFKDLIVHFDTDNLQLPPDAVTARLDGKTLDFRVIWGQDSVRIVH